jgi:hypothetical protein
VPPTRTTAPTAASPAAAAPAHAGGTVARSAPTTGPQSGGDLKDAFLAQIKASKVFFYNTVVAQAYRVDVTPARITFAFQPNQKVPRQQCEDMKAFLEDVALKVSGHKIPVVVELVAGEAAKPEPASQPGTTAPARSSATGDTLHEEAMADPSVQALFEIFPVEKAKVEEM